MSNSKTNLMDKNEVQTIVDEVVKKLKMENLPPEELSDFKGNLESQITRRLGLVILENLSAEGLKEYEAVVADEDLSPDSEQLEKIIKKYIPDIEEKIKAEMDSFLAQFV
ncbi:MAG: DUF5663 domain-containing protein [Patescibacteria group bacterium]|jgi:hypothetical protein